MFFFFFINYEDVKNRRKIRALDQGLIVLHPKKRKFLPKRVGIALKENLSKE